MNKIRQFAIGHKIISTIVVLGIAGGGYAWYASTKGATAAARYVIQKAATGSIVVSVSGTGQMQAVNTIDIKPQASAVVTSISVKVGDRVRAGQLLVQLDTRTEARALTQAQLQLQSAQLSLAKLTQAPATATLVQDQNAVTQAQSNIDAASSTLAKDYQAGYNTVTTVFVDLQTTMSGLQSFILGGDITKSQGDPEIYFNLVPVFIQTGLQPYYSAISPTYNAASQAYQQNLNDYQATTRDAGPEKLDALFMETYQTAQKVSESVKAIKSFLSYIVDAYPTTGYSSLPSVTNTWQTNLNTYTGTISGDVGNLSNTVNGITSDKASFANAKLSLNQASSSLAQLLAGADPLDVQSSQLSLQQQQLAVQTAEQNLADDSIRAPVDGLVSAIPAVVGATVPSPAVSLVGQNQVAQITLNEVDAAKVKMGDKATLTFSAISGLSLAGQVIEIDPVGTVSQGVVSYNAKIALASPNDAIKPGMSVDANVVTETHQDVLVVPKAAVVTQGGASYVLAPSVLVSDADITASANGGIELPSAPTRVLVTTGLSSNTQVEILSGLNPGDQIITQTIAANSASASAGTSGTNALRALGGGSFGGGTVRTVTGGGTGR